jgi:hypothetical protein
MNPVQGINTGPSDNNPILTTGGPNGIINSGEMNPAPSADRPSGINTGPGFNPGMMPTSEGPNGIINSGSPTTLNPGNNPILTAGGGGVNTGPSQQGPYTNVNQWGNPEQGQGEDRAAFLGRAYDNNVRLGNLNGGTTATNPAARAAYIANNGGPMSDAQNAAVNPVEDPNINFNNLLRQRLNAAADANERGSGMGAGTWGTQGREGWINAAYEQQKNRARTGAIGI